MEKSHKLNHAPYVMTFFLQPNDMAVRFDSFVKTRNIPFLPFCQSTESSPFIRFRTPVFTRLTESGHFTVSSVMHFFKFLYKETTMASKKLIFIVVVGLLLLSLPVHAEYTVDENLLYEEESSYTKSEAKLDLLATGRNGFTSNDGDDQAFSASVGGVHRVEKTRTGYWVDIKAAASHDRDENKTVNAVDQSSD
ncbi:MAG: hypothetical protein C4522_02765, partial [Desulfobacteraceae bacterium]